MSSCKFTDTRLPVSCIQRKRWRVILWCSGVVFQHFSSAEKGRFRSLPSSRTVRAMTTFYATLRGFRAGRSRSCMRAEIASADRLEAGHSPRRCRPSTRWLKAGTKVASSSLLLTGICSEEQLSNRNYSHMEFLIGVHGIKGSLRFVDFKTSWGQVALNTAPLGTSPHSTNLHRRTNSFRDSATIPIRRSRLLASSYRPRNHWVSSLRG